MVYMHTGSVFLFNSKTLKLRDMRFLFSTEWSKQKEITINFAEITLSELDLRLRRFYAEAHNQDGGNYSRATLLALRNGIKRYLNSPPNNRGISLIRYGN